MGKAEKSRLRAAAREARDALPADARQAADAAIAQAVLESAAFARSGCVFAYCSMGSEVNTHGIIHETLRRGKTVALPRCRRGEGIMDWHAIARLEDAVEGYCGICEPADDSSTLVDPRACGPDALALVPGLLFDDEGYRLGYGGGYYDRFLADFPGATMGLARESGRVESLADMSAREVFDRPVQQIATEAGITGMGRETA